MLLLLALLLLLLLSSGTTSTIPASVPLVEVVVVVSAPAWCRRISQAHLLYHSTATTTPYSLRLPTTNISYVHLLYYLRYYGYGYRGYPTATSWYACLRGPRGSTY